MTYHEYVGNPHMHTPYSDGNGYHAEIAQAAISVGIDFVLVTDHNIHIDGVEGYYGNAASGYVLMLIGEEIHDRFRLPQVNHCLVFDVEEEMCQHADDPQQLIDCVLQKRGMAFLAHPYDNSIPWLDPNGDGVAIPWVDWHVQGFTGLEIWNYMSVWKSTMPTVLRGLRSIFQPDKTMMGPRPQTLKHWDQLLGQGFRVVGIGGSDAHASIFHIGPFKHTIFPYDFLFSCVNTHIFTSQPLTGDVEADKRLIYSSLRSGHCFIGYGLPGNPRGFRLTAQGEHGHGIMGDKLKLGAGITIQCRTPERGRIKIIRHGEVVSEEVNANTLTYTARKNGAYRVEVWKAYQGIERCWILSNPVYVVD